MRRTRFHRFIAVLFGLLLPLAAILAMTTGDEGVMLLTLAVSILYAVYMVRSVRKERVQREKMRLRRSLLCTAADFVIRP